MFEWYDSLRFAHPEVFYLLAIPVLYLLYYFMWQHTKVPRMLISHLPGSDAPRITWRVILRSSIPVLRALAMAFLIVALARPQSSAEGENISTEGIDIILALDVSTSMLARDFKPDRYEAAKSLAAEFIAARKNDRIGLVIFAGESFTQCPLTTDHALLTKVLSEVKDGMIEDGTAIGMGLATAVERLKGSDAKSKVVILMTDGVNNTGFIDPKTAAEIAVNFDVRVYGIGIGSKGTAPYPFRMGNQIVYQNVPVEIDEDLLKEIAKMTGGKYYRAVNNNSLKEVFEEIDDLEKTKIEVLAFKRVSEQFYPFAVIAIFLLSLEMLIRYRFAQSFPS